MTGRSTIRIDAADELEELLERSVREQWGDGLPLVPPTRERVEAALDAVGLEAERVLGVVPPSGSEATVQNVTVNAIMAGCAPVHLPLVFAATEALCKAPFNVGSIQVTTNPVGVTAFVSGPLGAELGVNAGSNAFSPGNRANAAVGRAIRLVLLNIGGGTPGVVDKATFGTPGKYTWFFGENQDASPWPSWAERAGIHPGGSTVTVFGAAGYLNLLEVTSSADEMLDAFALSMASPNSNDLMLVGEPLLVLCPEHATVLADAGLGISDIQQRLWETARLPVRSFSHSTQRYRLGPSWTEILGDLTPETLIPLSADAKDIRVLVSGGAGRHSVYIPGLGASRACDAALDPYVIR